MEPRFSSRRLISANRLPDMTKDGLSQRLTPHFMAGIIGLGLVLRLFHYARNPSVWHDEAALILNVLGKGFGDLLGPLAYHEAAPPLFLWLERAVSLMLGDNIYSLRLVPLVASCASVVLFADLVRRVLP